MSLLRGLYPVLSSDYIYIENAAGSVGGREGGREAGRKLCVEAHSTCATRGGVRNVLESFIKLLICRAWLILVCKVLCCFKL